MTAPRAEPPARRIAGVRFQPGGRTYACDAGGVTMSVGDQVVVQTDGGTQLGTVSLAPALRPAVKTSGRPPRVLRVADPRDRERGESDGARAREIREKAREAARARKLEMKVFHAELLGRDRVVIYFAADSRVDFRDLLRDLGGQVNQRIELRQVGVRDEAKMVGGIGACGRELCCSTFLPRFAPVSIRAAKVQNLALTPSKVSGQCGRLKCCLVYEEAHYTEAAKNLPKSGKRVSTPDGVGRVGDVDVLRARLRVHYPDRPPKQYEASEVTVLAPPPQGGGQAQQGGGERGGSGGAGGGGGGGPRGGGGGGGGPRGGGSGGGPRGERSDRGADRHAARGPETRGGGDTREVSPPPIVTEDPSGEETLDPNLPSDDEPAGEDVS